jgi:hypothetical protein
MLWWISLALTFTTGWIGYGGARRFVRDRLRYVDAAHKTGTALLAGFVAAMVAAPVVWLLPIVTGATAIVFGVSVALGVRAGASDITRGYHVSSGN